MPSRSLRFPIAFLFFLTFQFTASHRAFGQGSKMKSEYEPVAEEDRDRPDLREEWMRNGRTAPAGESAAALRLRAHQQKMAIRARRAAAAWADTAQPAGAQTGWVSLGPAPLASQSGTSSNYGLVTGRATSVAIDPSDQTGNTVYLGGAYGGVWKSINAASTAAANVTWSPLTDQQASLATGAVSVKSDGSVVLVGTGEPNSAIDSYYGVGILRSNDKGATWALIASSDGGAHPFAGLGFSKFAWNTVTTGMVAAATGTTAKGLEEGDISNSANRGLYLSTDSGQTWIYAEFADGSLPISVTDVVYNSGAGKFFASVRYHGVYSSSNGVNWTRLANQPNPSALTTVACPANPYSTSCPLYRGQLAAVPGRNEMYFWFVDGNITNQGIWRSADGGNSWTPIPDSGITNCGDPAGCGVDQGYYNLEIAAVPNGSATDLYGGAVNLYKCTLNNTSMTSCSQGDWINLTHVYGCPNIANVHPDEHGVDFILPSNGTAILYFANDGGIYRTLDGFTKLDSGSCGASNGFDDLNGTMGAMTQFVSFSMHPTNKDILLGGTQDNGSPATATATANSAWQNANQGDGGYNAINPANPSQWFTENWGVSIQSCSAGTACNFNGFVNNLVVDSSTLSGDLGAFYTPFVLDPQNANELLIGTCRVWRGATALGSGYSVLSNNFDGTSGSCAGYNGNETDLVRSLGAGGQPTQPATGFSPVVYATTEGVGPNSAPTHPGGEVWITTNAGTLGMSNATGGINPSHYTISSVALDTTDTSGFTAYVGIMGFHVSHVWKTANAGASWTDWTGTGLPDAPVNALLVDAAAGQIYAGTDVGVFVSSTSSPAWTEVGPAAGIGVTGYLPNVPVSALRMFNSGGNKTLRASTYGRGIWEYPLADFRNVISNSPQTVFPAQTAIFNGTLTARGTYSSAVNLSCTAGGTAPPTTCQLNPTHVPAPGSGTYMVTAGGGVGNFSFNAHAVGTDTNTTTDAVVVLQVADLTAPSPGTITAPQGLTSNPASFQVDGGTGFSGTVGMSCSGLPTEANCIFSPSSAVTPPQTVTLAVSTTGSTPQGSSTVTMTAVAPGGATKTQSFTLQVTPPPDFTWTINGSSAHTVKAGQTTFAYNFAATPAGGTTKFASDVTFACSGLPDSTAACIFNTGQADPTKIKAGSGATPVSLTITTEGPNTGAGTGVQHRADKRSPRLPLALPIAGIIMVGLVGRRVSRHSAAAGLCVSLALIGLMVACGGLSSNSSPPPPQAVTVTPNPANVSLGGTQQFSSNTTVTWALSRAGAIGTIDKNAGTYTAPTTGTTPATFTVTATSSDGRSGSGTVNIQTVGITVSPSTTVNLWPTVAGWPAQTKQFTATVGNASNTAVNWTVSSGGGSIDADGNYTAAATVPNPATVAVTATSVADPSKTGAATVNIQTPTRLGTFNVTVTATEGTIAQSQAVTLTVQ